jgi:hypothetical protein
MVGLDIAADGRTTQIKRLGKVGDAYPRHGPLDDLQPTIPFGVLGLSKLHLELTYRMITLRLRVNHTLSSSMRSQQQSIWGNKRYRKYNMSKYKSKKSFLESA